MTSTFDNGTMGCGQALRNRMSTHLAVALLSFALLQIIIVTSLGSPAVFHLGIIIATGGFAVGARRMECRWAAPECSSVSNDGRTQRFARHLRYLWSTTIFVPLLWLPLGLTLARLGR